MRIWQWGLTVIGTGLASVSSPLSALFFFGLAVTIAYDLAPDWWGEKTTSIRGYLPTWAGGERAPRQLADSGPLVEGDDDVLDEVQPGWFDRLRDAVHSRLPGAEPLDDKEEIDEEEDRALARAALTVARQRVDARPDDAGARAKLERLEQQAAALYPDLLEDEDDEQPIVAAHPNRDPLFQALEERPHQLVIGHTGGGKTTLLHELATGWAAAGQNVMVCDPDAAPGQWPGCRVVGGGDDYEAIGKVLELTYSEMKRRRQLRKEGQRHFAPIRLVVDECADVIGELGEETYWGVAEPILRRGRKLNIHLTMGVQDNQKGTLKLDGKTHLMHNMAIADLYQEPNGQRIARFGQGKAARTLPIPALRSPEELIVQPAPVVAARPASMPAPAALGQTEKLPKPAPDPDALLADLLASAPPKQEQPTATATISRDGLTINVNASASAPPVAPARGYSRKGTTGPNVRQRAQKLKGQRKTESLEETYARLAHLKFEDAYIQAGGNRGKAHAAWRAARVQKRGGGSS